MGEGNMAIKIKEFSAPAVINYAHAQSGLPIIQSICLLNDGDEICMQAELTVATSPAFCAPVSFRVDYLPAHGMYEIKNVELTPDMDFLARPAENRKGHFHVTIREGDDSSQEFFFRGGAACLRQLAGASLLSGAPWLLCDSRRPGTFRIAD